MEDMPHAANAMISVEMHFNDNLSRTVVRPLEKLLVPSKEAKLLT